MKLLPGWRSPRSAPSTSCARCGMRGTDVRLYLDTSVVVAAITREPHTGRAHGVLARSGVDLVISDWTVTEVSAALSMKQRMGALQEAEREIALRVFERLTRESLVQEHILPADFARAAPLGWSRQARCAPARAGPASTARRPEGRSRARPPAGRPCAASSPGPPRPRSPPPRRTP